AAMPEIYDAVVAAGAKPFGMHALNSLRIEKGYRAWKGDLSTDYSLLEGGLERFVKFDKAEDFPGRAALLAEKQRGSSKRFVPMIVDAGEHDAPYMSTIWKGNEVVGETTSSAWGYRVDACIALGMVRADLAQPGEALEIEIFGTRRAATVQPDAPLWDPENARLRA
ncbi:MAG: glycine cleavage T C-terminal barrel domain-containing protein, partial [Pseudomonadota bacterium]